MMCWQRHCGCQNSLVKPAKRDDNSCCKLVLPRSPGDFITDFAPTEQQPRSRCNSVPGGVVARKKARILFFPASRVTDISAVCLTIESLEARRLLDAGIGILLLDHSQLGALYSSGSGGVQVLGGGSLVVDSTNHKAAVDVGAGNISAGSIQVTGGLDDGGPGNFVGTISHPAATSDPFSGLAVPPVTTPAHKAVNVSGNASITLSPGTYVGGIHISGNATVTLLPGVYVLQGGGLSVVGHGTLTGDGVTIYNGAKKPSDEFYFGGNATVTLTAPSSGPYQGVVLFQNPNSAAQIIVTGGNVHLAGAV